MNIRLFETRDYAAYATLYNLIYPDDTRTAEELADLDGIRDPDMLMWRYVAEVDGQVVGWAYTGHIHWSHYAGKFQVEIGVHPDHRRKGIGMALYEYVMAELAEHNPTKLVVFTTEEPGAVAMLDKLGFAVAMRENISRLDLSQFDPTPFAGMREALAESGIRIAERAELEPEFPDFVARWEQVGWDAEQDVPMVDRPTRPTLEVFTNWVNLPRIRNGLCYCALDGDQWVASSNSKRSDSDPTRLDTGFTGVLPSHRRRGITTAMKLQMIEDAMQRGITHIYTSNEENNPMYQINVKLGFEFQYADLEYNKEIPHP